MNSQFRADVLALDVTTTELAIAVRDAEGREDYAATAMRGGTEWLGDSRFPGFELAEVPRMLGELLCKLQAKGWNFQCGPAEIRYVSVSCRQHDQVLLDSSGKPLMPALSWQCNAASEDVAELRKLGVERSTGTIEPRFVLPKTRCVLRTDESLRDKIGTVFMTGDWIAYALTGERTLSTSDALSNGLLEQQNRKLAADAIRAAGLDVEWFPEPVQSGHEVGRVLQPAGDASDDWNRVRSLLAGWRFVAGLGDNHASAVGCGMSDDYKTMVVSGGTSGTINLACPAHAKLPASGKSLRFEFYGDSLLLLQMLGDCGAWYQRFLSSFAAGYQHDLDYLNMQAMASDLRAARRVLHSDSKHAETFPPAWASASLGEQAAWTQMSIVLELLLLVKRMLDEIREAGEPIPETFVLTGGLSQSLFIQQVFHAGVSCVAPGKAVKVSGRTGPLRYKTSAYGALINAALPRFHGRLAELHAAGNQFPLVDCARADAVNLGCLQYLLRSYGL
jgi:sugar (pentulose or hexulose) kinase